MAALMAAASLLIPVTATATATPGGDAVVIDEIRFDRAVIEDGVAQDFFVRWHVAGRATAPITVTVDVPEPFVGLSERFLLDGPDGQPIGHCDINRATAVCTVTDEAYVAANPLRFAGEFRMRAFTELDNRTTETISFQLGGAEHEVTVEPNPAWCTEHCDFRGVGGGKSGWYDKADVLDPATEDRIFWQVWIGAPESGFPAGTRIEVVDEHLVGDAFTVTDATVYGAHAVRTDRWGRENLQWQAVADATWSADRSTVTWTTAAAPDAGALPVDDERRPGREVGGMHYLVQWTVVPVDGGKAKTYTNTATYRIGSEATVPVGGEATRYSYSGRAAGTNFGRVEIAKRIEGDAAIAPTQTYGITVEAYEGATLVDTRQYTLRAGERVLTEEYFNGTRLVITETEPTGPDNVIWSKPTFIDASGASWDRFEVTIDAASGTLGTVTDVTLVNRADLRTTSFIASKSLVNDDDAFVDDDVAYTLRYSYPADAARAIPAGGGTVSVVAGGVAVASDPVPIHAVVTVEEDTPDDVPAATWQEAEITPTTFTATAGERVQVHVRNEIVRDTGGFSIVKRVTGSGAELVPDGAAFRVLWWYEAGPGYEAGDGDATIRVGDDPFVVTGLPAGAEVTLAEAAPHPVTGGHWLDGIFSEETIRIAQGTVIEIDLDNPIALGSGTLQVEKRLAGTGAGAVGSDASFIVDYAYPAGVGFTAGGGTITVRADGTPSEAVVIPHGAVVALAERTPAAVPGATWVAHTFDRTSVPVVADAAERVLLTNTVALDVGAVHLRKSVAGTGAALVAPDREYVFDWSYPATAVHAAGSGSLSVRAGVDGVRVDGLPAGAVVTFVERDPGRVPGVVWSTPTFSGSPSVTVVQDAAIDVDVANVANRTVGRFAVTKRIDGAAAALVPADERFAVAYSHPAGDGFEAGAGTLFVRADGTAVHSPAIPFGAVVTLSEATPADGDGYVWAGSAFSSSTVVIGDGLVAVELVNTAVPAVPAGPPVLPDTGGEPSVLALVVGPLLILLGIAACLFALRRTRSIG